MTQDLFALTFFQEDGGKSRQIAEGPQTKRAKSPTGGQVSARNEMNHPVDSEVFCRLYDFIGDDPEILGELIVSFITDTSQLVENMVNALPRQDTHTLTRTAHTLKSGSAMFGALTLSTLCQDVEALGTRNLLPEAVQKVALLQTEFGRVRAYLEHRYLYKTH